MFWLIHAYSTKTASNAHRWLFATVALAAVLISASEVRAQAAPPGIEQQLDVSMGLGKTVVPQMSYQLHFRIAGERTRLYIGPGLRLFGTMGQDWRLASENAPDDNFLDGDKHVDAIVAEDVAIGSLNLGFYIRLVFLDRWEVGANTDLIGLSFGRKTQGRFLRNGGASSMPIDGIEPKPLSIFPVSGSYNTEMGWIGYHVTDTWMLRAGFIFSDYKYRIPKNQAPNARKHTFERIYPMGLVGATWTL